VSGSVCASVYTYHIYVYILDPIHINHVYTGTVSRDEGTRTVGWTLDGSVVFERDN
jgi:hypothetical protein